MKILMLLVIIFLILGYLYEFKKYKKQTNEINYISDKLNDILENRTNEKILLFTDSKEVISLISVINRLLDYSTNNKVAYEHSKLSMMRMISNISHDLKTPLTTLKGYVEMLKMKFNEDKMIIKVESRIDEILQLINKFFDLAKLESGDKILKLKKINLCEVCRKNMFEFYNVISRKKLEVKIKIPEEPIYISGDEEALGRILKNLIDNAIKYGSDGQYLGIELYKNKEYTCVEVEDHGKGIIEKEKELIFERLYTLEDSRSMEYQGSGLGLTITKELVEKMNGKISLFSIPNEKTVFKILFPLAN